MLKKSLCPSNLLLSAKQAGNGLLCKLTCLASEYGNSRNQTATESLLFLPTLVVVFSKGSPPLQPDPWLVRLHCFVHIHVCIATYMDTKYPMCACAETVKAVDCGVHMYTYVPYALTVCFSPVRVA